MSSNSINANRQGPSILRGDSSRPAQNTPRTVRFAESGLSGNDEPKVFTGGYTEVRTEAAPGYRQAFWMNLEAFPYWTKMRDIPVQRRPALSQALARWVIRNNVLDETLITPSLLRQKGIYTRHKWITYRQLELLGEALHRVRADTTQAQPCDVRTLTNAIEQLLWPQSPSNRA